MSSFFSLKRKLSPQGRWRPGKVHAAHKGESQYWSHILLKTMSLLLPWCLHKYKSLVTDRSPTIDLNIQNALVTRKKACGNVQSGPWSWRKGLLASYDRITNHMLESDFILRVQTWALPQRNWSLMEGNQESSAWNGS
jgi:hypothetical protein